MTAVKHAKHGFVNLQTGEIWLSKMDCLMSYLECGIDFKLIGRLNALMKIMLC